MFLSSSQDPALAASSLTPVAPPPAAASQNSSGLRNKDLLARIRRSFNARSLPHTERKSTPARTAQGCSVAASTAVRSPIALSISGTSSTAQSAPAAPPPAQQKSLFAEEVRHKNPLLLANSRRGSQVFSPLQSTNPLNGYNSNRAALLRLSKGLIEEKDDFPLEMHLL